MDEDYLFPESETEKDRKKSRFERDLEKLGSVDAVKAAVTEPAAEGVSMARKRGGSAAVRAALAAAAENSDNTPGESDAVIPYDDISDIVLPELDFMTTAPARDDEPPITVVESLVSQAPVYADVEAENSDFSKYILSKEDIENSDENSYETGGDTDVIISSDDGLSDFSIEDFAVTKEETEDDYPPYVPSYPTQDDEEEESDEPAVHLDFASIASEAFDEEALAEYGRNITFDGEAPVPKYIPPKDDLSVLESIIGKQAGETVGHEEAETPAPEEAEPEETEPEETETPAPEETKAPAPDLYALAAEIEKQGKTPDIFAPAADMFASDTKAVKQDTPDIFASEPKAAKPEVAEPKAPEPETTAPESPEESAPQEPEPPKTPAARAAIAAAEDLAKIAAAVEAELAEQSDQDDLVKEREERESKGTRHEPAVDSKQRDNFDGVAAKTAAEKAFIEDETAKLKEPSITHQPRPVKKIISRHELNDDVIIEQKTNSLPVLGELGDEMSTDGSRVSAKSKRSDDEITLMRKQEAVAMNVLSEDSSEGGKNRILRITMDEAEKIKSRKRLIGRIMLYSANALTIIIAIIGMIFFENDNSGLAFLFRTAIVFGAAGFIPVRFIQMVISPFFIILALLFVMLGINDAPGISNIIFYIVAVVIMLCSFAVRVFSFSVKELLSGRR